MQGKILGSRYQVREYIAKGGFGTTYLAVDTQLPGRDLCVVKELSSTIHDPKLLQVARRLFKAEASALHNLGHHTQIPELWAYFEEDEQFYLVQQYIPGHTLEQELNDPDVWSESKVIALLVDILQILDFIHAQGVIHRDLKPANIIRRQSDRQLVLVDFGTVKNMLQGQTNSGQLTIPVGTQGYMPTEQARGKPQATSDLYALGIIAIQALTKVEPLELEEDDHGELQWSHLAQVSPQLKHILTKMTRYNPKDRYQSAAAALQDLIAMNEFETSQPKSNPASDRSWTEDSLPTVAVTELSGNNIITQLVSTNTNELDLSRKNPDLVLANQQTTTIEHILPISNSQLPKSKTTRVGLIAKLAIALGVVLVGAISWLLMQSDDSTPQLESSPPNNSETPRLDQGKGFRDNL